MEIFILAIIFATLGMMPLVSYYFGWLAGRPFRGRASRIALYGYSGFLLMTGTGFLLGLNSSYDAVLHWAVLLPTGFLLVVSPTLTIWFFFTALGQSPRGHCSHCGYNLRGNLTGRCPECGAVVHPSPE